MIVVEMEYLISSIAVLLFLYLIVFSYKNRLNITRPESSSWWPWKLIPYNEWPYWLGRNPERVRQRVPVSPYTSLSPVVHSRPWGGDSRSANSF